MMSQTALSEITNLRQELHQYPELSGQEVDTANRIIAFLGDHPARKVIRGIGGHGILLVYESLKPGKTVLIRADMDALPIQEETNGLAYKSVRKGTAHLCGHDGHSAILAGLARNLDESGINSGRVLLLFQPSEEDGQGAHAVLEDPLFKYSPDFVFAFHNLPGYETGKPVFRRGTFACASTGMKITLTGRTAHAAEPQKGISPEPAILQMLDYMNSFRKTIPTDSIVTNTHIQMGEKVFGIAPGIAEIYFTLRSERTGALGEIYLQMKEKMEEIARENGLSCSIEKTEYFPATVNDDHAVDILEKAMDSLNMDPEEIESPFRWSEDFSWFTGRYPGALFGLGSGKDQQPLHHPEYNFPDALIPTGILLFKEILKHV